MSIQHGSRVKIAFTATYSDDDLFDTSSPQVAAEYGDESDKRYRPIVLEIGAEPAITALQEGLLGMEEGETKTIQVPHADLQMVYPLDEFQAMVGEPAETGMKIHALTGLLGEVVAVDTDTVTVDFDPERSGEILSFDVEVLEVD